MSSFSPPDPNGIKTGDTAALVVVLSDANGPANLSGCSVVMRMRNLGTKANVTLAGVNTILQTTDGGGSIQNRGTVKYAWGAGETATKGIFGLDWLVTFADGSTRSFPNDRLVTLSIFDPA